MYVTVYLSTHMVSVLKHKLSQVACLWGYLLKNKTCPQECVKEVAGWFRTFTLAVVRGANVCH
jgi:hypothetical protein